MGARPSSEEEHMYLRRTCAAAATAWLLIGLSACGADNSAEPERASASESTAQPLADESVTQAPEAVAQEFAELVLSDLDVLNAQGISAALPLLEDYLTDSTEQALLSASEQLAWSVVPFHVPGSFGGGSPVEAEATTVSSTPMGRSDAGRVEVETVVKTVWVYSTQGAIYGEWKYVFTLVPEQEPNGKSWLIDDARSTYGNFGVTPECGGLEVPDSCLTQ
jgi:hypothetical protein